MTQSAPRVPSEGGVLDPPPLPGVPVPEAATPPVAEAAGLPAGRGPAGAFGSWLSSWLSGWLTGIAAGLAWALAGSACFVGLWQLAAMSSTDVPTPIDGARALGQLLGNPFYDNGANDKGIGVYLSVSLQRVFAGFTLAALVGIPAGLLIGASRRAWRAVNPVVQLLRPVSPLAWFPILLAVFRDAGQASVFVIFITALWPTLINTAAGAVAIPVDQRNVARVFRFGRLGYVRHVLIPNALPSVITGLRLSMGIAWMVIVAAEMLSGNTGIGFFVWDTYNAGNLANVTAVIVVIGLVGLVLDAILLRASRWATVEELPA